VYGKLYRSWFVLFLITLIGGLLFASFAEERVVYQKSHTLPPLADAVAPTVIFTEPLSLKSRQNIQVVANATVTNSWAWVGGDLIHEASGAVYEFEVPIEYYYGYEDGENWIEGNTINDVMISAVAEGQYLLRLEFDWEQRTQPITIAVTVTQDVPDLERWGWVLFGLTILPAILFISEISPQTED
jgi:hypothetical protein